MEMDLSFEFTSCIVDDGRHHVCDPENAEDYVHIFELGANGHLSLYVQWPVSLHSRTPLDISSIQHVYTQ